MSAVVNNMVSAVRWESRSTGAGDEKLTEDEAPNVGGDDTVIQLLLLADDGGDPEMLVRAQRIIDTARSANGLVRWGRINSVDLARIGVVLVWNDFEAMGAAALLLAPELGRISQSIVDTDHTLYLPLPSSPTNR